MSVGSLDFSSGKAEVAEKSDMLRRFLQVTVQEQETVVYTYELTIISSGKAEVAEISICSGDAFQVTLPDERRALASRWEEDFHFDTPKFIRIHFENGI
ncbi:activator of HSP90 ATPase [Tanacetum coccineum]